MGGSVLDAPRMLSALVWMSRARRQTIRRGVSTWHNTISLKALRKALALTDAELRWLSERGLIESKGGIGNAGRRTMNTFAVKVASSTCFRTTAAGMKLTDGLLDTFIQRSFRAVETARWDPATGQWTLNDQLVRLVAAQATKLRRLLAAAQVSNWPHPVLNPFADEFASPRERAAYLSHKLDILNHLQGPRRVVLSCHDKGRSFDWRIIA